ncbi:EpsG family protein [Fibrobacter sp. UWH1]|uniref:EpsG family protein n=1 Tax=Fibrobacter sp. UWH1 TaxID=1964354 RepID=UPI000B528D00|nr:EpsG family protein [Fibrobacter sp. UWH1]OWV06481.1 hypothetical protein B7992_14855 [Fibrobacter sp. UWH1]
MFYQRLFDERLWVYFLTLLLSLFLVALVKTYRKRTGSPVPFEWFWPALPFFLISAFRFCVGTDYYTYHSTQIPQINSGTLDFGEYFRYDLLFVFIVKTCNLFSETTFWTFFVVSISPFFYLKWVSKESPMAMYSVALYFFTCVFATSLNIIRQSFATGLFWIGFSFWIRKEKKIAIILFVLTFLMHRTALVFLPLLFVFDKDIKMKKKCIICLCLFCFSFVFYVDNSSLGFLNQLGVAHYFNSVLDTGDHNWRYFAPILLLFLLDWKYRFGEVSAVHKAYSNCLFFTLALICFSSAIPMSNRMIYMLLPVLIVYIPMLAKHIPKYRRMIVCFFLVYFMGVFYVQIVVDNAHQTLPYRTVWQKNEVRFSDYTRKMDFEQWFIK